MEIEVKDGRVSVNISATLTAEDLRQLLKRLCDAHAEMTGARAGEGQPLFFDANLHDVGFTVTQVAPAAMRFGVLSPTFGWVCVDAPLPLMFGVIGALATQCAEAFERSQAVVARGSGPSH